MLNYEVPPELLASQVPPGTTLDRWEGRVLVSLVGFRFLHTRVLGVPIPWHRDFEEVNLRFYVRREAPEGVRRAVVFLRELVPRRAIAWLARLWYNEPYRALPMRHGITGDAARRELRYEWRDRRGWIGLQASTVGAPSVLTPGTEAEFITEHYWGYTAQRDGGTVEYRVEHPPWRVWQADAAHVLGDLSATYGATFGAVLGGRPCSAFVAEGSAITVFRPRPLP